MNHLPLRVKSKIQIDGECWRWTGQINYAGYGRVRGLGGTNSKTVPAHRFVYELLVGPIAPDKQLDHLCRNRWCVRPDHLEPVSCAENLSRSPLAPATVNAAKTHCKHGHPLSGDNVYIDRNGYRECRQCKRVRSLASYHRVRGHQ